MGQWLVRALQAQEARIEAQYGFVPTVVAVANARDGLVHASRGLDLPTLLGLASSGRPLTQCPEIRHWPTALEGLGAIEADVLVEVTPSSLADGEPGFTHMREALRRPIPVVTSNKWPVALHGVELVELARSQLVAFRAESTVMSGTPVLSTLRDGLAGATPLALRGILNATVNFILTRMHAGKPYEEALAEAQELGLAERDPTADVEGYDAMAKLMILAGLVFRRQLLPEQVARRGITDLAPTAIEEATSAGGRLKHVATLEFSGANRGGNHGPRGAHGGSPGRSADRHRGGDQRRRLPGGAGRRRHDHRAWCGTGARRTGRAERPHRRGTLGSRNIAACACPAR